MGIQDFPAALQPIIQQGYLEREFEEALKSKLGYRMVAQREAFPNGIGETITKTRTGLLNSVTTPLAPSTNTNLDNGITPVGWGVEQYTLSINMYAAAQDLNMVTSRVGIVSQFLQNASKNAEQAARSLDELAQAALFYPYFGGNTRVRTTLGAAAATISVDDVRGFQHVFVNGVITPVSGTYPLNVVVGSDTYSLVGVTVDGTNLSTAPNGISGTLTFSTSVTVADGTALNTVMAATASTILRPNGRTNTSQLQSSDTLTMSTLLNAVAALRLNAVPTVDGAYNCYIDPMSMRQLFSDPDFKQLYQAATGSNAVFKQGSVVNMLGLRFMETTQAYVRAASSVPGAFVRRPIIVGADALVEGDFAGMAESDVSDKAMIHKVDDICMVTRPPLDRLNQIISQAWYWIGGFCVPSDTTTNPNTVPTANNANYKRAVMIEHIG